MYFCKVTIIQTMRHLQAILIMEFAFMLALSCSRKSYLESSMSATRIDERYEARQLESASGVLPYRMAHINPDSLTGKPWLVLYLQSANGRGTDNIAQFQRQKAIDSIYNYLIEQRMNAIMLVPQCPSDRHWSGNRKHKSYLGPVKELVDLYADSTDTRHMYAFGASMGGGGVWRLLNERPNIFAAALIASGMYLNTDPQRIAQTPLYVTLGGEEDAKPQEDFRAVVEVVRAAGGEVMFDIIPGLNHPQTCEQSFTAERIGWVFGHERR